MLQRDTELIINGRPDGRAGQPVCSQNTDLPGLAFCPGHRQHSHLL